MVVRRFPPVEQANADGLLCAGGDLEVPTLLLAYSSGIFPWPVSEEFPLVWFSPPKRTLLFLDGVKISRSLKKARTGDWSFSIDRSFPEVIVGCARSKNRRQGGGTWITDDMISAYIDLHRAGACHSVESWFDGKLAGGVYGVSIGRMFAGESMFYNVPNASKLALWHLTDYLRERGAKWLDCQQLTPLLASFGAREVPRKEFLQLLKEAVSSETSLF